MQDDKHQTIDYMKKQKCREYFVRRVYELSVNSVFSYFTFTPKIKITWFLALALLVYNIVVIIFHDHLKKG
jgi:hypothetical protein